VSITIGTVALQAFEVPASIHFGGSQRIAIHRLGNGQRIIDTLGHEDLDIDFSGVLSGPDAASRAAVLDDMCAAGHVVPLAWDDYYLSVIIRTFDANYSSGAWIPYSLTCVVTSTNGGGSASASTSPLDDVYADLASAAAVASPWTAEIAALPSLLAAGTSSAPFRAAVTDILGRVQFASDTAAGEQSEAATAQIQAVSNLIASYLKSALVTLSAGGL